MQKDIIKGVMEALMNYCEKCWNELIQKKQKHKRESSLLNGVGSMRQVHMCERYI